MDTKPQSPDEMAPNDAATDMAADLSNSNASEVEAVKRREAATLEAESQDPALDVRTNSIAPARGEPLRGAPAAEAVVASITSRYVGAGDRYYYDAGKERLAFHDRGEHIILGKQTTDATIRDVLNIATARGWTAIEVKGSPEFKRAAYLEAQSHGIAIRNYTPEAGTAKEAELQREKIAAVITGNNRPQRVGPLLERAYNYLDLVTASLMTPSVTEQSRKAMVSAMADHLAQRVRAGDSLRDLPAIAASDQAKVATASTVVPYAPAPGPLAADRAAAIRAFDADPKDRPTTEDKSLRYAYALLRDLKDALATSNALTDSQKAMIFAESREHVAKHAEQGKRLALPESAQAIAAPKTVERTRDSRER